MNDKMSGFRNLSSGKETVKLIEKDVKYA